jgi:hypothetical protein
VGPHRINIINTLQLIASPTDQLAYQQQVPGVNVAAELVNQWYADFSPDELETLAEFNDFYDVRVSQLPDRLSGMLESPVWLNVMAAANKVLQLNNWLDVKARYER